MKPRHLLMVGGLALAAALAWFGNRGAESEMAEPVARDTNRPPASAPHPQAVAARTAPLPAELPVLAVFDRASAIAQGRDGQHPERLFASQSWAPAAAAAAPLASAPVAAPAAPALPFSYIGRQMPGGQGGQTEVFLAQGDKVHVVRVHSLLDNTYRVDAISSTAVSFTYLPLNTTQLLSIGASD